MGAQRGQGVHERPRGAQRGQGVHERTRERTRGADMMNCIQVCCQGEGQWSRLISEGGGAVVSTDLRRGRDRGPHCIN